jgi:hypothetical protein
VLIDPLIPFTGKSATTRIAYGLNFRPQAGKAKAWQRFDRRTCNQVNSTRFETTNQFSSNFMILAVFFRDHIIDLHPGQ